MTHKFTCSDLPPMTEQEEVSCGLSSQFWSGLKIELPPSSPEDLVRTGRDFIAEVEGLYEFNTETYSITLIPYYRRNGKIYCKIKGTNLKAVICHG